MLSNRPVDITSSSEFGNTIPVTKNHAAGVINPTMMIFEPEAEMIAASGRDIHSEVFGS